MSHINLFIQEKRTKKDNPIKTDPTIQNHPRKLHIINQPTELHLLVPGISNIYETCYDLRRLGHKRATSQFLTLRVAIIPTPTPKPSQDLSNYLYENTCTQIRTWKKQIQHVNSTCNLYGINM